MVRWWRNCCGDCSVVGVVVTWERFLGVVWWWLVMVAIVVVVMVAWLAVVAWLVVVAIVVVVIWLLLALWLFGGAKLVVVMVVEIWSVQNNDSKRKTCLKGSQPGEHE